MADKKISELTELTTPDGTEELVFNDSGVSKKVQIDNLLAGGTISNFTSTGIDDNATSTAITIDASENVSLVGTLTGTVLNDSDGNVRSGRKNLIINGGFDVWQRGTSGFGHNVYSADRWREDFNTGNGVAISKHNISSGGETGLPLGFTSAFKYALTVGSGSGSGLHDVRQKIELPKRFEGQTFTLSYYVKASSSCTVSNRRIYLVNVTNPFSGASLPSLSVTTTWQKVTDTFTFGTSSTAVYSSSSFLDLVLSAPVATSVDIDYYITGVQLELGSVATDFEHRSYGEELALCQRYYQSFGGGHLYETVCIGITRTTADVRYQLLFSIDMRVPPTLVIVGPWRSLGTNVVAVVNADMTINTSSTRGVDLYLVTTGHVAGESYQLTAANDSTARLQFSAEL